MVLAAAGDHAARERVFRSLTDSLRADGFVAVRRAAWLFDTGQYHQTISQLTDRKFSLYEGKRTTHRLFADAHMILGQRALEGGQYDDAAAHFRSAMTYPWNLGVGRSRGRTDMKAQYYLGLAMAKKGDAAGSIKALSEALTEARQFAFPFVPLKSIRWETDTLLDDAMMRENETYEAEIRTFLDTVKKEQRP
jgi:tetratricopeptide (TPR) repeat protein